MYRPVRAEDDAGSRHRRYRRVSVAVMLSGLLHALASMHCFGAGSFTAAQQAEHQRQVMSVGFAVSLVTSAANEGGPPRLQNAASAVLEPHAAPVKAPEATQTLNDKLVVSSAQVDDPYYTLDMLDSAAQPMADFDIAPALLNSIQTRLLLEFWIDRNGEVRELRVIEPAGTRRDVTAIMASLRTVRFRPAMRGGMPVNSRKLVELATDGGESALKSPHDLASID
jgi:hypothetical protein